jgi:hypothetical protein
MEETAPARHALGRAAEAGLHPDCGSLGNLSGLPHPPGHGRSHLVLSTIIHITLSTFGGIR